MTDKICSIHDFVRKFKPEYFAVGNLFGSFEIVLGYFDFSNIATTVLRDFYKELRKIENNEYCGSLLSYKTQVKDKEEIKNVCTTKKVIDELNPFCTDFYEDISTDAIYQFIRNQQLADTFVTANSIAKIFHPENCFSLTYEITFNSSLMDSEVHRVMTKAHRIANQIEELLIKYDIPHKKQVVVKSFKHGN